jgi:hypothetical protein
VLALLTAVVMVLAAACSDGGGQAAPTTTVAAGTDLRVRDVEAAVRAVEAARGGPQRYTEINAITTGVNVFVAVSDTDELDYFFTGGGLTEPEAPKPLAGEPFTLEGVDLTAPARLVDDVHERFPGSRVTQVALVRLPDLGLVWGVRSRSSRGGDLNVFFTPDGRLQTVAPAP